MSDNENSLKKIQATVEQLRDEINLKAHLGQAEAKEELEKLEHKWNSFLADCKPVTDEAEKTAKNTGAALALAGEEIMAGYQRLRKLF